MESQELSKNVYKEYYEDMQKEYEKFFKDPSTKWSR
jgi:hypothetical protein